MKIKLAILEKDKSYLNRIVTAFNTKYADKFTIYTFTDSTVALSSINDSRVDVLIASDVFDIDAESLPMRCGFAYLVDSADVVTFNEQRAICKFQKVDLIYKQILSIYSENAISVSGLNLGDESSQVIVFASPSGGTGSSSVAAACAVYFAGKGKKTLYLCLEKFGSSDAFFSAEGQFGMSDIIFALKSKKANLSLKFESSVKQDARGVYFYSQPKIALDMLELNPEEVLRLVTELKLTGGYDYIILDMDFSMDKSTMKIYQQSHALVMVGDGSEISNTKIHRAYTALSTIEQKSDAPLTNRTALIYNKFSNKTSRALGDIGIRTAGGVPRYEHATTEQVVNQLAALDIFSKII